MEVKPLAQAFFFDSFIVDPKGGRVVFEYSTDAGHHFAHVLTHALPSGADAVALAPAAFALGMAELSHYWKAILAPKIVVKAGALTLEQVAFWENLYTKGLGEFFYKNDIDFRDLVHVVPDPAAPVFQPTSSSVSGALLPFGGGKDALVTGEILKQQGKEFVWFELEPLPFSPALKKLSGTEQSLSMGRDVQKNFAPIVELVRQGAPNGHVPITATYIFSAVFIALAHGSKDVVPSLERSAEFGNVEYLGTMINHQYSKSFEFEQAAHAYVQRYINQHMRVFSLLRPLYEIQIVERFVNYPQYFQTFVSCNRGLKTGTWCGECAKCAFMFASLSAFLEPSVVVGIFKKNLFEDSALIPLYKDMAGLGTMKPFDCVGTFEENLLALYLSGEQYKKHGLALPTVLTALPIADGAKHIGLLKEQGPHAIPPDYA